ncbi:septal ring lytic transglycosylase RlpA family protein [Nevskia sp.]|uniref:septal ring lytic transglycosylase RlpA family protein n=1 Tax=Nevskia sp. TaxID=1929292 RepID=UPI0025D3CF4D|nr:septal ring lytic transglycosylase RlpA family protein [Nevskia sp.]
MKGWQTAACLAALLSSACVVEPVPSRPPYREPLRPGPAVNQTATLPPAPASEQDRPPAASEIPANVSETPDAVPEPVERSRYGNPDSYEVFGKRYVVLADARGFKQRGHASWYGKKFHGRRTSSGERYDMFAMTAAHKTLPIPTYARVTNLSNGKSVVVRVNDRGPFHKGRIVDLSYTAAAKLDLIKHGSAEVQLEVVDADGVPMPAPVASAPVLAAAPEAPPVAAPVVVANVARTPRFLQAGVFNDTNNALTFRDHLMLGGIKPLVVKSTQRNGKWVYRVLVGPFEDAAKLAAMRTRLSDDDTPTVLVHE